MLNKTQSLEILNKIQAAAGKRYTNGLSTLELESFLASDADLLNAIEQAHIVFQSLSDTERELCNSDELELVDKLQAGYMNFYSRTAVIPFVPLAAKGPWIITSHGAVVYEIGGYGMLGMGHNPEAIRDAVADEYVMANIMSPSFQQARLMNSLKAKIGFTRSEACPFYEFVCMNSGSESLSVASRISDLNAKILTDAGGRHAGKQIKLLGLEGSFHGRTARPAQVSGSTMKACQALASFRDRDNLVSIPANDIEALEKAFKTAEATNVFFEAMFVEPVMGEGNPGLAITPEFYKRARELCTANNTLLIVDSVQAGLRVQGVLSIIDYPGFENLPVPDIETYSKAINAGQIPLSIVALTESSAKLYKPGVYGNTMTANPRALQAAVETLDLVTESVTKNIRERGKEFLGKLEELKAEFPDVITLVRGTGLLLCAELIDSYPVTGPNNLEMFVRQRGVNVVHGGKNALRFTPHFNITSKEIDLVIAVVKESLENYQVQ